MPREIRTEDAKIKKNIEKKKIKYPRKKKIPQEIKFHSRNKNTIEILKDKLRKSTRMWRRQGVQK